MFANQLPAGLLVNQIRSECSTHSLHLQWWLQCASLVPMWTAAALAI